VGSRGVELRFGVAVLIAALLATAAASAAPPTRQAKLQRALDELVATGVPGAVLVVRERGRTFRLASGVADRRTERAMRPDVRFRVGSVTKSFVATTILQLASEQTLALDDTVERWLPGLVPNGDGISLRQLLNHTGGLYEYYGDPQVLAPYVAGRLGHRWAPRRLVELAVRHTPLFAPGARFEYSNTGYLILGLVAEAAAGKPLARQLRDRIIGPLRLRGTSLPTRPSLARPFARGYSVIDQPPAIDVTGLSPTLAWSAGALVSTGGDLASFYRALVGGQLLRPALLAEMQTTVPIGPDDRYGLGLWRTRSFALVPPPGRLRCRAVWGHNGDLPGYHTDAFSRADAGRQAVLLVNTDTLPERFGATLGPLMNLALCA
jgi:D-alanyl-D-alanine carboxypeptidase